MPSPTYIAQSVLPTYAADVHLSRADLASSQLELSNPESLLKALQKDPHLARLFSLEAGVFEGYSILEHTETVYSILKQYPFIAADANRFTGQGKDAPLSPKDLIVLIAFHDLAKYVPWDDDRSKEGQHERTRTVLEHYRSVLPVSDDAFKFMQVLLRENLLGNFFLAVCPQRPTIDQKIMLGLRLTTAIDRDELYQQGVNDWESHVNASKLSESELKTIVSKTKERITELARELGVSHNEFLQCLTTYFQCDCGSYTYSAYSSQRRGQVSMDFLFARQTESNIAQRTDIFVFDQVEGRLKFSYEFEALYQLLKED